MVGFVFFLFVFLFFKDFLWCCKRNLCQVERLDSCFTFSSSDCQELYTHLIFIIHLGRLLCCRLSDHWNETSLMPGFQHATIWDPFHCPFTMTETARLVYRQNWFETNADTMLDWYVPIPLEYANRNIGGKHLRLSFNPLCSPAEIKQMHYSINMSTKANSLWS